MGIETWRERRRVRHEAERRLLFEAYERSKRAGKLVDQLLERVREQAEDARRVELFGTVPRIVGDRVVLDRVVSADEDALRDLIANPNVQRYLPTYLFEKQRDDVGQTIRLIYGDLFANKESLILAIRLRDSGELAGLAEFYGLRDELHKVSVGYRLREAFWGRGLATETAELMVGYLYEKTDIQIVTASVMVENPASARVLEKCGFIRTARGVEEDWGFEAPVIVDKFFC